jgi:hypothetical protein
MENLDELIITKTDKGLNYCNKNGFDILKLIHENLLPK